jgi:hypothetical protein
MTSRRKPYVAGVADQAWASLVGQFSALAGAVAVHHLEDDTMWRNKVEELDTRFLANQSLVPTSNTNVNPPMLMASARISDRKFLASTSQGPLERPWPPFPRLLPGWVLPLVQDQTFTFMSAGVLQSKETLFQQVPRVRTPSIVNRAAMRRS